MNFRHIQTFVTVAEQGTVLKAARLLHIAQPALSRQIGELESRLGVKLFDRVRRRLILTGEGNRLLADCRRILDDIDTLGAHAQMLARPDAGLLKIAATPQTVDGVFAGFLHRYRRRYPDVQIKVQEAIGAELFRKLEHGDLNLGVTFLQSSHDSNHVFGSYPLPAIEFLAAGDASFRPDSGGNVDICALEPHPLLVLETGFFVRKVFDHVSRAAGFRPNIFMESRTPHTLLAMAEAGHGVAIVPSVMPTQRYRIRIARITHEGKPLREPLTALWDSRRVLPQYAQDFCKMLYTYMQEVFPISQPFGRTTAVTNIPGSRRRK